MSEAGYTAPEALAALAIIGLALGGLSTSLMLVGRHQGQVQAGLADVERRRALEAQLDAALATGQLFRSDDASGLRGGATAFDYPCGGGRCAARLGDQALVLENAAGARRTTRLRTSGDLAFEYLTATAAFAAWPPAPRPPPAPAWEPLRAVVVRQHTADGEVPVAIARLWRQQSPACQYDLISQDCREAAP